LLDRLFSFIDVQAVDRIAVVGRVPEGASPIHKVRPSGGFFAALVFSIAKRLSLYD
jgi:hypothetical protein